MVTGLLIAGALIGWGGAFLGALITAGRIQRLNYYPGRFSEWTVCLTAAVAACAAAAGLYREILGVIPAVAVNTALAVAYAVKYSRSRAKFVFTARGKRLFAAWGAIQTAAFAAFAVPGAAFKALFLSLFFIASPLWMHLAAALLGPAERKRNLKYLTEKSAFYKKIPAIKIAVTGSFGKTTVKEMLKFVLSGDYTVLATAGNMNTPFGVLSSVAGYKCEQVIITEFGARRTGDISELIKLFPPDYAIITGVTAQHLETFKTLENVCNEKFALARAVPPERLILNVDNAAVFERAPNYPGSVTVGAVGEFTISHFRESAEGICFLLNYPAAKKAEGNGKSVIRKRLIIKTSLHGRHNASDAALAAAAAIKLGVPPESVAEKLSRFKGVPHRFEVKKAGEVTVIDDGYNSNIDGVRSGIDALKYFPGRKVVAAQGVSESGESKARLNSMIGESLSGVADLVLTTGKNAGYILKGLKKAGYKGEYRRFKDFAALEEALPSLLIPGDTVWFQNDIP